MHAARAAQETGHLNVTNVVMLGAFSRLLDVPPEKWKDVILKRVPAKYVEMNKQTFHAGRMLVNKKGELCNFSMCSRR